MKDILFKIPWQSQDKFLDSLKEHDVHPGKVTMASLKRFLDSVLTTISVTREEAVIFICPSQATRSIATCNASNTCGESI